jgi:hypothetical protein
VPGSYSTTSGSRIGVCDLHVDTQQTVHTQPQVTCMASAALLPPAQLLRVSDCGRTTLCPCPLPNHTRRTCIERTDRSSLNGDSLIDLIGLVLDNSAIGVRHVWGGGKGGQRGFEGAAHWPQPHGPGTGQCSHWSDACVWGGGEGGGSVIVCGRGGKQLVC